MHDVIKDMGFLRQKSENATSVAEALDIIVRLKETLSSLPNGIGLAAIQIGFPKRVGVVKLNNGELLSLINPSLLETDDEFVFVDESCLSLPNNFRNTKRYRQITIKNHRIEEDKFVEEMLCFYYSLSSSERNNDGLATIAIQHELDHFDGKLILDHNVILEPFKRKENKVGRNDPCPCGSNKKYKKCCGK